MRNLMTVLAITMLAVFMAGNVFAISYGTNITISDENTATNSSWYGDQEDQEVEPGMVASQVWDLEGFFLNGTILSMIGGYDFLNGEYASGDVGTNDYSPNKNFESGDIFIDVNGDAVFGDIHGDTTGNVTVNDTFGYDYVLDLDFGSLTYDIIALTEGATTMLSTYYKQNYGSNPWKYVEGGTQINEEALSFGYVTGLTDADTGFLGGTHNVVTNLDLAFLGDDINNMTVHFTMECGNDNLMGSTPEPATMLLLGSGLFGLAGLRRKFRNS
jgi:hypothetical protein